MIPTTCANGIITNGLTHCAEVIPAKIIVPAKIHHKEFDTNTHTRKSFKVITVRRR